MRACRISGLFLVVFGSLLLFGQNDRHLTTDGARGLYQRSVYAHGYIHGYEDGFHNADMDVHMGRGERSLNVIKDYKECAGYQRSFGDRRYFQSGYKQGFREGYADSIRGGQFRAIQQSDNAAAGLEQTQDTSLAAKDFDRAFSSGYDSGRDRGLESDSPSSFEHAANTCNAQVPRSEAGKEREYCDVYMRGFALGFNDGQAGRVQRRTQTATK